ncbi:MAG: S41 family peptidase [Planctomycetota bacterium]|nr:S41 family peptidase [Planctomycetota bacterium]
MTYRLEDRSRLGRIGLAVTTVIVASFSVKAPADTTDKAVSLNEWADLVWDAGIEGDKQLMHELIDLPPNSITSPEASKAYRECVNRWHKTRESSVEYLEEARLEALSSLETSLEEDNLADALKFAVAYQELIQDFDIALQHESVQGAIQRADSAIPGMIASGDLMQAQEVLFRLKTAYEDTSRLQTFDGYDDQLEDITTRLQILRRYDPQDFHDLYRRRAEARGDEATEIRPFNPSLEDRWQQEVSGVRVEMLRSVLDTAAREHINSGGWQPLLTGGIEALRTLAKTPMIDDTFEGLSDPKLVAEWIDGLGQIELNLEASFASNRKPRDIGRDVIDQLAFLNNNTVQLPLEVLWREFGDGAMDELDRFSEVIWPYDIDDFNRQMQGEFIGVGVYIEETELGEIRIVSPLEGKPADIAGIRSGDIIASVDGVTTTGWSLRDAVREITGPADTSVTIGIKREDDDQLYEFTIVRDLIRMHTVKGWNLRGFDESGNPDWQWFIDPDRRIAYIRMTGFDQQTYGDFLQALGTMQSEHGMPTGLILDLRHNPGGLLETAVNISNLFVSEGRIVSGEDRFGESSFQATARKRRAYLSGTPVVVLINNGSASASEIVAGCLQAHEAGIVVGARSFGKGSVQTVHPVTENAKLKLTTQYYRLPSPDGIIPGRMVHKVPGKTEWGVEPDIMVSMTPEQIMESINVQRQAELQEAPGDWDEAEKGPWSPPEITKLLDEGLDPQLHTALVILQAKIYGEEAAIADSR